MQTMRQKAALAKKNWKVGEEVRLQYGEKGKVVGYDQNGRVIVEFGGGVKKPYMASQLQDGKVR